MHYKMCATEICLHKRFVMATYTYSQESEVLLRQPVFTSILLIEIVSEHITDTKCLLSF